jgi:hypothetical protein
MALRKKLKTIAIISYLIIFLRGDMIGFPFFIWLALVSLDIGNIDQVFALLGIIGLIASFLIINSPRTFKLWLLDIACFLLLLSPLIERMAFVPLEMFNYLAFIIPTVIFVLLYLFSICTPPCFMSHEANSKTSSKTS